MLASSCNGCVAQHTRDLVLMRRSSPSPMLVSVKLIRSAQISKTYIIVCCEELQLQLTLVQVQL